MCWFELKLSVWKRKVIVFPCTVDFSETLVLATVRSRNIYSFVMICGAKSFIKSKPPSASAGDHNLCRELMLLLTWMGTCIPFSRSLMISNLYL